MLRRRSRVRWTENAIRCPVQWPEQCTTLGTPCRWPRSRELEAVRNYWRRLIHYRQPCRSRQTHPFWAPFCDSRSALNRILFKIPCGLKNSLIELICMIHRSSRNQRNNEFDYRTPIILIDIFNLQQSDNFLSTNCAVKSSFEFPSRWTEKQNISLSRLDLFHWDFRCT